VDTTRIASEFLRALRAHRSQLQWSRWLGYRSNVAYTWESGRRWPTAAETLRAAGRAGVDVRAALRTFYGADPVWAGTVDPATAEGVARLLDDLRGSLSVTDMARRVGTSRSAMSRWLSGATQPRLPDFFAAVEAASVRLVDFVTYLLPLYDDEGKAYVTIAIGCTGGQHRSVAVSIALARALAEQGREVNLEHRDARGRAA